MLKIGSHVGMSGKEMMLGSAKEAVSYGANTFMLYTGAPQNTRRKNIEELNIDAAWEYMKANGIEEFVVHAPYIINLANTVKPDIFTLAVDFLKLEIERTEKMGSHILVLHPGSHVGQGADIGIAKIVEGLNEVLTPDQQVYVSLETMAGKGSEVGRNFEEIARIYDGVKYPEKLRVCFDTCHTNDAGYDLVNNPDKVFDEFDKLVGLDQISVIHVNDSKNPLGAGKDRHENVGFGNIGFEALYNIITDKRFENVPKILETPYIPDPDKKKVSYAPYKYELEMIRQGKFNPNLKDIILNESK